jgi:hypothetical protein
MDWIHLAQNRDRRRAPVNMLTNLRVPYNVAKLLSGCTIVLSSIELVRWLQTEGQTNGKAKT